MRNAPLVSGFAFGKLAMTDNSDRKFLNLMKLELIKIRAQTDSKKGLLSLLYIQKLLKK